MKHTFCYGLRARVSSAENHGRRCDGVQPPVGRVIRIARVDGEDAAFLKSIEIEGFETYSEMSRISSRMIPVIITEESLDNTTHMYNNDALIVIL